MSRLAKFFHDFARAFYAPRSLYTEMREGRATPSWLCVLIYCTIYVIGAFGLYFNGYQPFVEPWITLDPEIYYLAEAFYSTPLIFLMWIQGSGTIHVLSKLLGGKGRFDTTLRMTGYSFWAPWYPLIIVDVIHSMPEWLYNAVLAFCMLLLIGGTTVSTKVEEDIGWVGAFIVSIVTVATMGVIIFTFIR